MKRITLLLVLALVLTGCAGFDLTETVPTVSTVPTEPMPTETIPLETTQPPSAVDILMAEMTLRQKVGQLFIVAPEGLVPEEAPVTDCSETLIQALAEYPVGGIILFGDNLENPEQLTALNTALQEASLVPLFLSVDEEGGSVARLANHPAFDLPRYRNAASVGASGDPAQAEEMGAVIGAYLAEFGFNLDFAPVADVNTNPDNPVIGKRSFSSNPELAAQMAWAMAQGLNGQGITAVYKHFPGHGDTAEDSHAGLAISWKTEEEMRSCEWLPFRMAGSGDMVMVGHIAAPELTGDHTPATMSAVLVTEKLKGELGFSGLVITDSLSMGAITDSYSAAEAAVNALSAGCDLLLMPEHLEEAFNGVLEAIHTGVWSEKALEQTVRQILEFKLSAGLLTEQSYGR